MVLYSKHLYDVDLIQIKKQIIGSDHSSELSDFFKATVNEIEIYLSNLDQEEEAKKRKITIDHYFVYVFKGFGLIAYAKYNKKLG